MLLKRVVLMVLMASALGACDQLILRSQPSVTAPIAYGPETERQVETALQRYSQTVLSMDAGAVAALYAPDGVMERSSGPLVGRDAIRAALADTRGVRVVSMEMITSYISYSGPAVVQTGDFKQSAKLPNGKIHNATGRFEATWMRSPTGEWWIRRMVTRPNAAKPAS